MNQPNDFQILQHVNRMNPSVIHCVQNDNSETVVYGLTCEIEEGEILMKVVDEVNGIGVNYLITKDGYNGMSIKPQLIEEFDIVESEQLIVSETR